MITTVRRPRWVIGIDLKKPRGVSLQSIKRRETLYLCRRHGIRRLNFFPFWQVAKMQSDSRRRVRVSAGFDRAIGHEVCRHCEGVVKDGRR